MPPMCPPPPPPPPRACAPVAIRLPASSALARIIIVRPRITFSIWMGGRSATGPCQKLARFSKVNANVAMDWIWELLFFLSTKFSFNQPMNAHLTRARQARPCIDRVLLKFQPSQKIGRRAPALLRGHEVRRAPSSRQPQDIASEDRRGCSERELRFAALIAPLNNVSESIRVGDRLRN